MIIRMKKPVVVSDKPSRSSIYIVVQGLFELSDSIGYDAYHQYKVLSRAKSDTFDVFLVAEKFKDELYPDADIMSFNWFLGRTLGHSDHVVYHYCDGWSNLEDYLEQCPSHIICRWHNNTPPWFYAGQDLRSTKRTVTGFERIRQFVRSGRYAFAVNSPFTGRQLAALGYRGDANVVYPATKYLSHERCEAVRTKSEADTPIRLLFVSRIVAHKGHKHVITVAEFIKRCFGKEVEVHFAGRHNSAAREYDDRLKSLSDELDVKMVLHGELTDDELRNLYDQCDVFCCFSEHEGFGLPIFEAYTRGLPSVSWARCAIADFTGSNPLSIRDFSIRRFACAILAACDPSNAATLSDVQYKLMSNYSEEIVAKQIVAMLDPNGTSRISEHSVTLEGIDLKCLCEFLDEKAAINPSILAIEESHEYGENLVSEYDIDAYTSLLNMAVDIGTQGGVADRTKGHSLEIGVGQFSSHDSKNSQSGIVLTGRREGFDVFGPYIALPAGHYRVEFRLSADTRVGTPSCKILADVNSERRGTLAESVFEVRSAEDDRPHLSFLVRESGDLLEFRLRALSGRPSSITFVGTTLTRLADPAELVAKPAEERSVPLVRHLERKLQQFAAKLTSSANSARLFQAADELRNKKQWREAAEEYARCLKIQPTAREYHVQAGHCFKEARHFEASAFHYEEALAMGKYDPDLLLNMGHLYKRMGRIDLAELHYAYAVSIHPAIVHAVGELADLGVSTSQAFELAKAIRR